MIDLSSMINPALSIVGTSIATVRNMLLTALNPWGELVLYGAALGVGYYMVRQKWILTMPGYALMGLIIYCLIKFAGGIS